MEKLEKTHDKIALKINKLFKPFVSKIEKQSKCAHKWKDKNGSAYYRCSLCGYLADDSELDSLIFEQKLLESGVTEKRLKEFRKEHKIKGKIYGK
jgi:hypothetical protein